MLIEFTDEELKTIRVALSEHILSQKAGLYSEFNAVAKKIDKETDKNGE